MFDGRFWVSTVVSRRLALKKAFDFIYFYKFDQRGYSYLRGAWFIILPFTFHFLVST